MVGSGCPHGLLPLPPPPTPHFPTLCLAPTAGNSWAASRAKLSGKLWHGQGVPWVKQAGGLPAVMISCELSLLQATRLPWGCHLHIFPFPQREPTSPLVEHVVTIPPLETNICESWPQARSALSYFAVSSPTAQSRGFSEHLSTLPGQVEHGMSAGNFNQGEQDLPILPPNPVWETHVRKVKENGVGMGWKVETVTRNSPEFGLNANVIISLSTPECLGKVLCFRHSWICQFIFYIFEHSSGIICQLTYTRFSFFFFC